MALIIDRRYKAVISQQDVTDDRNLIQLFPRTSPHITPGVNLPNDYVLDNESAAFHAFRWRAAAGDDWNYYFLVWEPLFGTALIGNHDARAPYEWERLRVLDANAFLDRGAKLVVNSGKPFDYVYLSVPTTQTENFKRWNSLGRAIPPVTLMGSRTIGRTWPRATAPLWPTAVGVNRQYLRAIGLVYRVEPFDWTILPATGRRITSSTSVVGEAYPGSEIDIVDLGTYLHADLNKGVGMSRGPATPRSVSATLLSYTVLPGRISEEQAVGTNSGDSLNAVILTTGSTPDSVECELEVDDASANPDDFVGKWTFNDVDWRMSALSLVGRTWRVVLSRDIPYR